MKKIALLSLLVAVTLLGTSCGGLFGTNLFAGLESYEAPIADLTTVTADDVDDLVAAAEDDRFFDTLEDDEVATAAVLDALDDVYLDPTAEPEEVADAALLAADVVIYTSGVDESLTAMNDIIGDMMNYDESDPDAEPPFDLEDPASVGTFFAVDPDASEADAIADVQAQLEAFVSVADALGAYGDALVTTEGSDVDLTELDNNAGDTATKALVSGVVATLVAEGNSTEEIAAAIVTGVFEDPNTGDPILAFPEIVDPTPDDGVETTMTEMLDALIGPDLAAVVNAGINLDDLGL